MQIKTVSNLVSALNPDPNLFGFDCIRQFRVPRIYGLQKGGKTNFLCHLDQLYKLLSHLRSHFINFLPLLSASTGYSLLLRSLIFLLKGRSISVQELAWSSGEYKSSKYQVSSYGTSPWKPGCCQNSIQCMYYTPSSQHHSWTIETA